MKINFQGISSVTIDYCIKTVFNFYIFEYRLKSMKILKFCPTKISSYMVATRWLNCMYLWTFLLHSLFLWNHKERFHFWQPWHTWSLKAIHNGDYNSCPRPPYVLLVHQQMMPKTLYLLTKGCFHISLNLMVLTGNKFVHFTDFSEAYLLHWVMPNHYNMIMHLP